MRNLAKVASILKCNIESAIRLSTNCRLLQFSTEQAQPTKTRRKKHSDVDERTLLASREIKKHALRGTSKRDRHYRVLDKEIAKQFADFIMSDPAINPSYVAEIDPAYGLLTRELLDAGLPRINLFETLEYFHPELSLLEKKYPGRVELNKVSFDAVCMAGYKDWIEETDSTDELLKGVEKRSWDEEPTVHIIGAVPDALLITRLMSMAIYRITLAKCGRMVLHLAMPQPVWATLSSGNENYSYYRSRGILFQILFSYRLLGTLPASGFYPKFTTRSKTLRRQTTQKYDKNTMCVVRMEPKCDLHKHNLTERDILPLFQFVKHHYKKRTSRIIPEMEKWVPGCGRELIAVGYNITTEFGELLPDEIIKLFLLFKSWSGYEKSSFVSMMNALPVKIDEQTVFGTTADKVDEMFKLSKEATNAQAARDKSQHQDESVDRPK